MAHIDVFRANMAGAFSMSTLTTLLLDMPHVPSRLGDMGLFTAQGIRTTTAAIERQNATLRLVPVTPRGGVATQNDRDPRKLVQIPSVRIAIEDHITADEIQNIRALGSESDLMSLQDEVNRRNLRMSRSIEATLEWQRVGAINGLILDADGSTILDLHAEFGGTAQTEVDLDLDNASPTPGALRTAISGIIRTIEDELGGLSYDFIHGMCSSEFFDALVAHPDYREQYKGTPAAQQLGTRTARRTTEFGGVTWEEYRGTVGGTRYVPANKAKVFPVGVDGMFQTFYSPAEWWETVNTVGLPRYAKLFTDPVDPNSKVTARVQAHPITLCTRPRALVPVRI